MEPSNATARIRVPYYNLVLGIEADESVGAELQVGKGTRPGRNEEFVHATLAVDIDSPSSELGFGRADGDQGLDWIVRDAASSKSSLVRTDAS
jgi:hypothetical protein